MKAVIIVCARLKSRRVPNKCAIEFAGKTSLNHLHDRLLKAGLPIVYAVPTAEYGAMAKVIQKFDGQFQVHAGHDDDPLARMSAAAKAHKADLVIRVTHDKIFVDTDEIPALIETLWRNKLDYVYSSSFAPGTGFEVITASALHLAAEKYKRVEHISYAVRAVTIHQMDVARIHHDSYKDLRLLIDFPEDVEFMTRVFETLGPDATLEGVMRLYLEQPYLASINRMPRVTVYTCAYNAEKWIEECMGSVARQANFRLHEYILVDDCSTDRTFELMQKFASIFSNVTVIRNEKNLGLASSSNVALENARGRYIVRLDADDYFTSDTALSLLVRAAEQQGTDVIYPANYFGKRAYVQMGRDAHHVGGALFETRALNHLKFTDGLRNYEGLDLFKRAQDVLTLGYLDTPIFMYRQHDASMSKTNLEERARVKAEIEERT